MKRIAINGSNLSLTSHLSKAFAAMTGMDMIVRTPYSSIASMYKLDYDISKCQWPESFLYCLGAFTQRIIAEQKFEDYYISDGGVFNELCWLKSRYLRLELIYERSMILCLENVVSDYALNHYDFIFHLDSNDPSDFFDQCLKEIYRLHDMQHHVINASNGEDALNEMSVNLQVKPVLSAKHALLKVDY